MAFSAGRAGCPLFASKKKATTAQVLLLAWMAWLLPARHRMAEEKVAEWIRKEADGKGARKE
jgi:hypothetical protein